MLDYTIINLIISYHIEYPSSSLIKKRFVRTLHGCTPNIPIQVTKAVLTVHRDKAMLLARSQLWSGLRCFVLLEIFVCGLAAEPPVGLRVERVKIRQLFEPLNHDCWELSSPGFKVHIKFKLPAQKKTC